MPSLQKLFQDKGEALAFFLVTIDWKKKKRAKEIITEKKVTFPVLLDLKEKVMDAYLVRGWIPQTHLIDREGVWVGKIIGPRNWASAETRAFFKELFNL